jgi:hypothetical protein
VCTIHQRQFRVLISLAIDVMSGGLDNVIHRTRPLGDDATDFLCWRDRELQKADERLAQENWERGRIWRSCFLIDGRVAGCESVSRGLFA